MSANIEISVNTNYDFYSMNYGGDKVPENEWDRLALKAEQRLKSFSFGRIPEEWDGQSWENLAKCAVCEMVEQLHRIEQRNGITSENNDGYSVTYEKTERSTEEVLYQIAKVYLVNTGLLSLEVD